MTTLNVCGGKYTLINEGGRLERLRNGEKWRDLTPLSAVVPDEKD